MKIVLAPFGTRGDIEPMLALGEILRQRGHRVVFCTPENFGDRIRALGFAFHPAGPDFGYFMDGTQSEAKILWKIFRGAPEQFSSLLEVCADADAVVGAMLQVAAPSVAEKFGIPYFYTVFSSCYLRSTSLPVPGLPFRTIPAWAHRVLWRLENGLIPVFGRPLIRERGKLGFRAPSNLYEYLFKSGTLLLAVDPELLPIPADAGPHSLTGIWRLPDPRTLAPDLTAFLDAGPPPVYAGFGSMKHRDFQGILEMLIRMARKCGQRLIVGAGWSGVNDVELPAGCHVVGDVPHAALFPRVAAVIHHGGAGTLASAAIAGVPQIVVPHFGDQYYHGLRVFDLGLGPLPISLRTCSADRLAGAIREVVGNPDFLSRARSFGETLRPFDGAGKAADIIEETVVGASRTLRRT